MEYRKVLGTVDGLRRGFTSGTCAQAAAKAAATALVEQRTIDLIPVVLPSMTLELPVYEISRDGESACYGIYKDSGDDDDVTNGKEFRAEVSFNEDSRILVLGGTGVGTVTREGLPISPGSPAINPRPRRRIEKELTPLQRDGSGFSVTISVPEGEELAKRTWNPRLGVEGGISIIGTSGIIEPKSSRAYKSSIALNVRVVRQSGFEQVYLLSGYVGEKYTAARGIPEEQTILFGDYAGFALDKAVAQEFSQIILCAHIGKMAKVAAGLFNTHCTYGDARLETIAAHAALTGADRGLVGRIMDAATAEEAAKFIREHNLPETFDSINRKLLERCLLYMKKRIPIRSVLLDLSGEVLSDLSAGEAADD